MHEVENPWTLRVSGMGGYTSKCEKKSKSLHPNVHFSSLSLMRWLGQKGQLVNWPKIRWNPERLSLKLPVAPESTSFIRSCTFTSPTSTLHLCLPVVCFSVCLSKGVATACHECMSDVCTPSVFTCLSCAFVDLSVFLSVFISVCLPDCLSVHCLFLTALPCPALPYSLGI